MSSKVVAIDAVTKTFDNINSIYLLEYHSSNHEIQQAPSPKP